MQTAGSGPDLMSTAVIAALPVAASGHLGNLGLIFISAHTTLRDLEGLTHIARHLVEAVERVRRDEIREKWPEHKALMYKTRFIWRKDRLNLTEGRARRAGERERLKLEINRAYMLKEFFRQIWFIAELDGQSDISTTKPSLSSVRCTDSALRTTASEISITV